MGKWLEADKAAAVRINRQWPSDQHVRAIEVDLLRVIGHGYISNLADAENTNPGGGIVVAYDLQGRQFKIEITQVDGPV